MLTDLKYAIRQLVKAPGFTAVVVLSLALGIGAITTVFCWIEDIMLQSLPGADRQEQMVVLTTVHDKQMWDTVSLPDPRDYRELKDEFSGIIGSQITPACLTVDDHSEWIYGQIATANFFDVLRAKPMHFVAIIPDTVLEIRVRIKPRSWNAGAQPGVQSLSSWPKAGCADQPHALSCKGSREAIALGLNSSVA